MNLLEGLQYFHTVHRKLHLNIAPESIVITAEGVWKLCSFGLSLNFQQGESTKLASPYFLKADNNAHIIRLEPDLKYGGPEMTEGGFNPPGIRFLTPATDIFSLGLLFYEIYRFNIIKDSRHSSIVGVVNNAVNFHQAGLDALSALDYSFLPPELQQILRGMIQFNPTSRVSPSAITSHTYFTSGALALIKTIDGLGARDVGFQAAQLIALPQHLSVFPTRIIEGIRLNCPLLSVIMYFCFIFHKLLNTSLHNTCGYLLSNVTPRLSSAIQYTHFNS